MLGEGFEPAAAEKDGGELQRAMLELLEEDRQLLGRMLDVLDGLEQLAFGLLSCRHGLRLTPRELGGIKTQLDNQGVDDRGHSVYLPFCQRTLVVGVDAQHLEP